VIRASTAAALFLCAVSIQKLDAQPPPAPEPVPNPPPIPDRVRSGETLEPEVTITRRARETVTEYRINGRLRAIRVEPDNAPAYYLVDTDGDGDLETRRSAHGPELLIPMWLILSW
jgi:hypothetical protein